MAEKPITIVTHDGSFHTDDVFAVAGLLLLIGEKNEKVVRTRDRDKIDKADYVVDLGGLHNPKTNRFDHHQANGAGERKNGVPYASFGLVWLKYGKDLCGSDKAALIIEEKLVQIIDAIDNGLDVQNLTSKSGVRSYLIHDLVSSFRPAWDEKGRTSDRAFLEVVAIAKKVLKREIILANSKIKAQEHVTKICEEAESKQVVVLEDRYPWTETLLNYPEIFFVVQPDESRRHWRVRAVPLSLYSFENRKKLPKSWAGKQDSDLQKVTGVKGAIFCHNKRFVAAAKSKEDAIKLAELALEHPVG